jgi:hypothetical protein
MNNYYTTPARYGSNYGSSFYGNSTSASSYGPLAEYGTVLIPSSDLALLRGTGNFNPPPYYNQTMKQPQDSASAMKAAYGPTNDNNQWPKPPVAETRTAIEPYPNPQWTWDNTSVVNNNPAVGNGVLKSPKGPLQGANTGQYIIWALNSLQTVPTPLLNLFFSDENVEFLQQGIVNNVKNIKNVDIKRQNVNDVLVIMRLKYIYAIQGYINTSSCPDTNNGRAFADGSLENQLRLLNQSVLEECVKTVLSGIEEYQRYYSDISKLPVPMTLPACSTMKGSKALQENLGFESGKETSIAMSSFNQRYNMI